MNWFDEQMREVDAHLAMSTIEREARTLDYDGQGYTRLTEPVGMVEVGYRAYMALTAEPEQCECLCGEGCSR